LGKEDDGIDMREKYLSGLKNVILCGKLKKYDMEYKEMKDF